MTFYRLCLFILREHQASTQVTLNNFLLTVSVDQYLTKQAVFEAREKLSPSAFIELRDKLNRANYACGYRRQHDFRLIAVDGTVLNLPASAAEVYGGINTAGILAAQAQAVTFYDPLNEQFLAAEIRPYRESENAITREMMTAFLPHRSKHDLFIFDRNFFATDWAAELSTQGLHYLFRVRRNALTEIDAANLPDQVLTLDRRDKGVAPFKVRVITVRLSTGETEKLVTNVFDEALTPADFAEIYRHRWGEETAYLRLKTRLALEEFSSGKQRLIEQDFHASILAANLVALACRDAQVEIDRQERQRQKKQERRHQKEVAAAKKVRAQPPKDTVPPKKYAYKPNFNVAVARVRDILLRTLTAKTAAQRAKILGSLTAVIPRSLVPIRPDRSNPRQVKYPSSRAEPNRRSNRL
jgi:hypothetical protein